MHRKPEVTDDEKKIDNSILMSKISKIERAIASIKFTLGKRRDLVASMSRKMDLNENQKIYIGDETALIKNIEFLLTEYTNTVNQNMGKLPPQATDLEEAVLGAIILESGVRKDGDPNSMQRVGNFLLERHFYTNQHKAIYRTLLSMFIGKIPIDMRTLVSEARKNGCLEDIGGAYYIAELTSKVSSAANIEYHARIIIEMAIKRELILMAGKVIQTAFSDTTDCFELLEETESHIKEIQKWKER